MKTFGKYLEEKNKGLWDNIHAKRKRGEKMRKPGSKGAPTDADFERSQKESVEEKKLTPAELKKREEIAQAMERDNPGMDMSKKMAIATAQAKKVAEEVELDEISKKTLGSYVKKAAGSAAGISAVAAAQAMSSKGKSDPNDRRQLRNRLTGISRATDKLTKEEVTESATMGAVAKKMSDDRARNKSNSSSSSYGGKTTKSAEPSKASSSGPKTAGTAMHKAQISSAADRHDKAAAYHDKKSKSILGKVTGSNAKHKAAADLHRQASTHLNSTVKNYNQSNLTKAKSASDAAHASTKKLSESLEEQPNRRKGAPKMTGDSFAMQRAKDAELNKALGRTKTGRKKPERTMTSTQRSLAQLRREETELAEISKKTLGSYVKKASRDVAQRSASNARDYAKGDVKPGMNKKALKNWKREIGIDKAVDKMTQEAVQSADKKPEKYVKPDGKVGIRMVRVNKNVVDKDA